MRIYSLSDIPEGVVYGRTAEYGRVCVRGKNTAIKKKFKTLTTL